MSDEGSALVARAKAERDAGRTDAALDLYREAAEVARRDGDIPTLARRLSDMGDIHQDGGRLMPAATCYDEALSLYVSLEGAANLDVANLLRAIAMLYEKFERPEWAAAAWEKAREFYAAAGVEAGVRESELRLERLREL